MTKPTEHFPSGLLASVPIPSADPNAAGIPSAEGSRSGAVTSPGRRRGWFAAMLLVLGVVAGTVTGAPQAVEALTTAQVIEHQLLQQLNAERGARGLPAMVPDAGLQGAARGWSTTMAGRGSLVHSSNGRAEIIARGWWSGQVTDAWMRSDGHRNLIVDPNLTVAGVGVTCDGSGQMWATVQFYQANTALATLRSSSAGPIITPSRSGSDCGDVAQIGQVRRLYSAYFRRESDGPGLAFWVGRLSQGSSLADVASFFSSSAEFNATYGRLSNGDFVRLVYRNVMNRQPDSGGYQFWVSQLDRGMSRGAMMIGFSESAEFRSRSGLN